VIAYGEDPVVAIVDSTMAGQAFEGIPVVATVQDALALQPTTALVGIAPPGGVLPPAWRDLITAAIAAGLDIESGLHAYLADDPELAEHARRHGVELRDLRRPPADLRVPTGENLRHGATVVLTVGSDCGIGKMTVSLELHREAQRRGLRSVFVPTGQTGIAIAGWGIAVDDVVSDFVAGAAERLVVDGARRGDLLWVEGQASIVHPRYSGVSLGLYHGSVPHLLVLCHVAGRTRIGRMPEHPIPPLAELVELHERIALPARPARVAAIALNTSALDEAAARRAIADAHAQTGLPADDPVRFGAERTVDAVLAELP
jgi:D-glutamate N-acetyltransferase